MVQKDKMKTYAWQDTGFQDQKKDKEWMYLNCSERFWVISPNLQKTDRD